MYEKCWERAGFGRFALPVALFPSCIAGEPGWMAGGFVLRWIQQFPYQLNLKWLPPFFLAASLLVLLIAWLTVAGVTIRAAARAPLHSWRVNAKTSS